MKIQDLPHKFCKKNCPLIDLKVQTTEWGYFNEKTTEYELVCCNYPKCQEFLDLMNKED
jgi:hypothetical protein